MKITHKQIMCEGVPLISNRKLKASWSFEAPKDLRAEFGIEQPIERNLPKWASECPQADWLLYKLRFREYQDLLSLDDIAVLLDNGRFACAENPNNKDIWFIISNQGLRKFIIAFNGDKAVRCKLKPRDETAISNSETQEIWLDTQCSLEWLSEDDIVFLRGLVSKALDERL